MLEIQFHYILTWKSVVVGSISGTVFNTKVGDVCCPVLFNDFINVLQILICFLFS